jgi:hypothetical protein
VAALLFGLILNVGAAWMAMLASNVRTPLSEVSPPQWPAWAPADWPPAYKSLHGGGIGLSLVLTYATNMVDVDRKSGVVRHDIWDAEDLRAGWPLPALGATRFEQSNPRRVSPLEPGMRALWYEGVADVPIIRTVTKLRERRLPVRVLLPGFLLDWGLYAACCWIVGRSVGWLIRSRRGGCENCGYDLRGLAADPKCPECGTVPAPASN